MVIKCHQRRFLWQKRTKVIGGRGSASDPDRKAYDAYQTPCRLGKVSPFPRPLLSGLAFCVPNLSQQMLATLISPRLRLMLLFNKSTPLPETL
jgi:hypothetical protein